jgi:hypothetical protein
MTRPKRLTSLAQIDQRTIAARQVRDTIAAIEADQGGRDQMTTAMQKVAETAAVTTAMVNDMAAKWLNGEEVDPALSARWRTPSAVYLKHSALSGSRKT